MSESIKGLSDDNDTEEELTESQSDLMKVTGGVLSNINYKVAFLLFIIGMFIFSDIFIDNVLKKCSGCVEADGSTSKGTLIQLLFLVIAYILMDLVVKYDFL